MIMEISLAVLCEAISVVVRRDSIDKYFKGGWVRFQEDIQIQLCARMGN